MKTIFLLILTSWLTGSAFAQQGKDKNSQREVRLDSATAPSSTKLVTVILQNNAIDARTVTLRFTEPGNPTYGVVSTTLGPNAKRRETYPVGTKIEQLSTQQQNVAMTGGSVAGKLIVTLKASDNGRIYRLFD